MEKMPYQPEMELTTTAVATAVTGTTDVATSDWRSGLPMLATGRIMLRELRLSDAPSLLALLTTDEVSRFISPPPNSVEGFERFIAWTHRERQAGNYACFAVVPHGMTSAVGIFQIRTLERGFRTAEWGFAMGSGFWGTGVFLEGARMVLDFVFDTIGVHRLEARASVSNGRGNGALRKVGAAQEGLLRRAFERHGQHYDQVLWSILAEDWRLQRLDQRPRVH